MARRRRYTAMDVAAIDLLAENRRLRNRVNELENKVHGAADKHEAEMARFERNYRAVLTENRRLQSLGETYHVGYDPRTEEVSCGNCGWILESDFTYCPNCAGRIDYTVARDEDDWRYDVWRERDL